MSRTPRLGKGEPAARVIEALRSLGTADGVRAVGIAQGAPTRQLPVNTPAPKVSTPRPGANEIEVPVLGRAQPAVASNAEVSGAGTASAGLPG